MRRNTEGYAGIGMKKEEARSVRTPWVVTIVVLCHTLAVGTAFLFIQGCATTSTTGIGQSTIGPPPEPIMPPTRSSGQIHHVPTTTPRPIVREPIVEPMTSGETYVVQKGDSLSRIAKRFGVNHRELAEVNGITDPNKIKIGQSLTLPAHASKSATVSSPKPATTRASTPTRAPTMPGGEYVVQPGDALSKIARRHGVKVSELKAANSLSSDLIRVGQKLVIPGGGAASSDTEPRLLPLVPDATELPDLSIPDLEEPMEVVPGVEAVGSGLTTTEEPIAYTVLTGDTLENIAKLFLVAKEDLVQLNSLSDGDGIKPGMMLLIPPPDL